MEKEKEERMKKDCRKGKRELGRYFETEWKEGTTEAERDVGREGRLIDGKGGKARRKADRMP